MKIIIDSQIPLAQELFTPWGDVKLLTQHDISHQTIKNADCLIIRSVTKVNKELLETSQIKFVGSTTSGMDHMDLDWLKKNNIDYANAPGCNADAVCNYVISCVDAAKKLGFLQSENPRVGIIGVGQVGKRVARALKELHFTVLLNDPPRSEGDASFYQTPLSEFNNLDLICLHTPLTINGQHKTFHLIEENFLKRQKPHCLLLNAGRGAVIDNNALLNAGRHLEWCFDVWEDEPNLHLEVLAHATIATPHIAGNTIEAKQRGTIIVAKALQSTFKLPDNPILKTYISSLATHQNSHNDIFDVLAITKKMKVTLLNAHGSLASEFIKFRQAQQAR